MAEALSGSVLWFDEAVGSQREDEVSPILHFRYAVELELPLSFSGVQDFYRAQVSHLPCCRSLQPLHPVVVALEVAVPQLPLLDSITVLPAARTRLRPPGCRGRPCRPARPPATQCRRFTPSFAP